jgi:hypothetical protein
MAIIDGFYRELVTHTSGTNIDIQTVLKKFPATPAMMYPEFDTTKLSNVKITNSELANFIRVINSAFRVYYQNGSTNDNFIDAISPLAFIALYQAKEDLGGVFGLDSSATLFASAIRPITFTAANTTPQQNWKFNITTAGWNTGFFTVNTANTSSTANLNLYNNVTMLIVGFAESSPSVKLQEIQFITPSGVKEGVKDFPMIGLPGSTNLLLLDQSYYIGKNLKYTIDANFSDTGAIELKPIGLQFMTAQYFNQE